jgi:type IV secretory pathway VirB10-like protein
MPSTIKIERPPGPGRAWMIGLVAIAVIVGLGIYFTRPNPKPAYNAEDLKQPAGAGMWADKEPKLLPTPVTPIAEHVPAPTANLPTFEPVRPQAPVYRQMPKTCPACDARRRLLASAQGSSMTVKVPGANSLEVPNRPPPVDSSRAAPPDTVLANSWIYATLETGIKSDQPGDVLARVSQNVRDTVSQVDVLIPVGSKLHGTVRQPQAFNPNNTAVTVVWDSLQLPNGTEVPLPKLPSADTSGYPGLSDKVNRHVVQTWAPAVLISAITAASMMSTTSTYGGINGYSPTSEALGQFGSSLGSRSVSNLSNELQQLRPSIEIRPGTAFRILVTHDISFTGPWEG